MTKQNLTSSIVGLPPLKTDFCPTIFHTTYFSSRQFSVKIRIFRALPLSAISIIHERWRRRWLGQKPGLIPKMSKVKIWPGSLYQLSFLRVALLTHDARVIQYSQQRPQFHILYFIDITAIIAYSFLAWQGEYRMSPSMMLLGNSGLDVTMSHLKRKA